MNTANIQTVPYAVGCVHVYWAILILIALHLLSWPQYIAVVKFKKATPDEQPIRNPIAIGVLLFFTT